MKILSWNVNGLRSAWNKGFCDFVNKYDPDILCLQEIKISEELVDDFNIEGYHLIFNCAEKKGYSGVAVYSKVKPKNVCLKLGLETFDKEGRLLVVYYENFVLVNVYLPHGGRDKSKLNYKLKSYDILKSFSEALLKENDNVIFCGDFNVAISKKDLARANQNLNNIMFTEAERNAISEFLDLGFVDSFRFLFADKIKYSWWPYIADCRTRNVGWRIDYVFVSENLKHKVKDSFILNDVFGSDHCPVGVELNE